jgi:MFS family permease
MQRLLPLVGQKLAAAYPKKATAMMSACIIAAQLVMVPTALLVGRTADTWERKPLFLAGFTVLPIRAVLYTFSDNSFWLWSVSRCSMAWEPGSSALSHPL